jgi:hypothetical protein
VFLFLCLFFVKISREKKQKQKKNKKKSSLSLKYAQKKRHVHARVPSLFSRAAFFHLDGFEYDDETETRGRRRGGKGRTRERAVVCVSETVRRYRGEVCVSSFDEHGVTVTLSRE